MKKIFLIAFLAIAFTKQSFSQARFGIQVGPNMSFTQVEQDGNDDLSNKAKFGIVAGFVADVPFGPISFRPEINFIQKGYKNTTSDLFGDHVNKVRLNYLEVPLNFAYNIPAGSGKVFLGLGPNFGFGINGKNREETTFGSISTKTSQDVKFDGDAEDATGKYYHLKRFDFGGNLVAGYVCDMGLSVGVSFTLGLTDVSPNKLDPSDPDADGFTQKNHSLNLKIGYLFGGSGGSSKKTTSSSNSGTSSTF